MAEKKVFVAHNQVRMHDTDMARRLYFARQFRFAHDALEDFVSSGGMDFDFVFHEATFVFVIVHCEADYFGLLKVGDKIDIHLTVEHIGNTSFTIFYEIFREDKSLVGTVKTVHVTLDRQTQEKLSIPERLRDILEEYKNHA